MKRHIIKIAEKSKDMIKKNKLVKRYGSLEFDGNRTIKFKLTSNKEQSLNIHKELEKVLNELGYELLDTFRLNRNHNHRKVKK